MSLMYVVGLADVAFLAGAADVANVISVAGKLMLPLKPVKFVWQVKLAVVKVL
jgi:hypothetical protein